MSKISLKALPGKREINNDVDFKVGTQIAYANAKWEYHGTEDKPVPNAKGTKEIKDEIVGVLVKVGNQRTTLDIGAMAQDLSKFSNEQLMAAGITRKKDADGRVELSFDLPMNTLGRAKGVYYINA